MLFQVTRVSTWNNEKPYDKCIPIKLNRTEVKNFKSFEAYDNASGVQGKWLSVGKNHRVTEEGYIARDFEFEGLWGVELNSLEDLLNFKEKVGEDIILSTSVTDNKTPCLIIYDDYIE